MSTMSNVDLNGMVAFVRVVELGSFGRASESLGISKATVSKQVSALERKLGVRLLHRTTRRSSLTEAGEAYLRHAQAALLEARAAEGAVASTHKTPQGRLRVTAPMSFGLLHVAPWVSDFLARYPQIDLDLRLDDRQRDLVLESFDVAVRLATNLAVSSLVARKLAMVRVVLCASPAYLNRRGRPIRPDQLSEHDCLHYAWAPHGRTWELRGEGETVRIAPGARLDVNSSLALKAVLLTGGGIARIPEFSVADELKRGELEIALPGWRFPDLGVYAMMPERRYVPAKVRVFIEHLSQRWLAKQEWAHR